VAQVKPRQDDRRTAATKFLGFSFAPGAKSRARQEDIAAKKMAKGVTREAPLCFAALVPWWDYGPYRYRLLYL